MCGGQRTISSVIFRNSSTLSRFLTGLELTNEATKAGQWASEFLLSLVSVVLGLQAFVILSRFFSSKCLFVCLFIETDLPQSRRSTSVYPLSLHQWPNSGLHVCKASSLTTILLLSPFKKQTNLSFFGVLGIKFRALDVIDMCFTTEFIFSFQLYTL